MKYARKKIVNVKKEKNVKKQKEVETIENLSSLLKEYEKKLVYSFRIVRRLKDLLSRNSALKLKEHKLNKLKNKLKEAEEEYSFSQIAIDQISFRMSQIS